MSANLAEDPQVYAAISDAFYNARNSGRTMTDAATDATEAVASILDARLAERDAERAEKLSELIEASAHSDECEWSMTTGQWDCVCAVVVLEEMLRDLLPEVTA